MNTNQIGAITESVVISELLKLEYSVFTPFGDGDKIDMIAVKGSEMLRIQVKTSRARNGHEHFNAYSTSRIRSVGGSKPRVRYSKDDIDYICTISANGDFYMIPIEEISTQEPRLKFFTKYIVST